MPLFHIHGLMASTMATLSSGGTVVVPPKFDPLTFWAEVEHHRATWYSAVPTIHQMLLMRNRGEQPAGAKRLRFIRSSSSALSPETMHRLESRFGSPVLEAYGMTEASHQMASNPLPPAERRAGTVGRQTGIEDRKSTRLNSSHMSISYAVFCLKKKKKQTKVTHPKKKKKKKKIHLKKMKFN